MNAFIRLRTGNKEGSFRFEIEPREVTLRKSSAASSRLIEWLANFGVAQIDALEDQRQLGGFHLYRRTRTLSPRQPKPTALQPLAMPETRHVSEAGC